VRGLRRYPMEIESTVYFCATVALRALAARDHAVPLRVRLADTGRDLVLTINRRITVRRAGPRRPRAS